jgi:hypothetical protein
MAKVFMVTEAELNSLRERLELSKLRSIDSTPSQKAALDDMHRTFNYHVCTWINEISR